MSPDLHTLTGAYALDALPDDEREEFERHLEQCEACQQEVAEFHATAARLASAGYETPPAEMRERVMERVDTIRQDPPTRRPTETTTDSSSTVVPLRRRSLRSGLLAAAAAIFAIAAIALGAATYNLNQRVQELETASNEVAQVIAAPDARTVSLETEVGGTAQFVYSPTQGEAVFLARGLPTLSEDEVYELWLIGAEGPVPAGLFLPGEDGTATRVLAGGVGSAQAAAVTVEPAGGSEQPTSDPIVVFELRSG
ncbi:MAG: anti-sigma factor [Nitriliruptorales bacterium]|nr:anti-sigma factor [Nitriliruptorales bacterium]